MTMIGTWRPREIHFGRVMVFIDGPNFYRGILKSFNLRANELNLVGMINGLVKTDQRSLVRVHFYDSRVTGTPAATKEPNLTAAERKDLQSAIRRQPYFELHLTEVDHDQRVVSEEVDIRLAVDLVSHAARNAFDVAILFTSDVDFVPAIKAVKNFGRQVELAYIPERASDRLIESADLRVPLGPEKFSKRTP